jgi:peptidyl-prolyl cis-trans isomerase SurA|tara:strand:+ start:2633 stop:3565 length:933 start_codon:yes stop_codon:yes gene_type:complete
MIIKKKFIILFLIFYNLSCGSCLAVEEVKIILKINNKVITNFDIKKEAQYLMALNDDLKSLESYKILDLAKDSIIKETIKVNVLEEFYNLNASDEKIDLIITNFYKKLNFENMNDFKNHLNNYGITVKGVKNKIKIESLWNSLIYNKFYNRVEINTEELKKKIKKKYINQEEQIYLLSEILYTVNSTNEIDEKYALIKQSILDIGFNNTANIYSISDSNKIGGKIGWVNKSQLSDKIFNEIEKINTGEITKPIKIVGGYLILKIEEQKIEKKKINLDEKLRELIDFETNKQLNQFSLLFFNKSKLNQRIE